MRGYTKIGYNQVMEIINEVEACIDKDSKSKSFVERLVDIVSDSRFRDFANYRSQVINALDRLYIPIEDYGVNEVYTKVCNLIHGSKSNKSLVTMA